MHPNIEKDRKHYRDAFEKIPEDKQVRIRNAAMAEFAEKGFVAANINIIAKKAGISIGALYNYFASKESLFLYLIDHGYRILEGVIGTVNLSEGDIFEKLEKLMRAAQTFSKKNPELIQIYLDASSEGLSHLSPRLSRKMETITARFYRNLTEEAVREKCVRSDLDVGMAAFCIDNLILLLQHSYTSGYFKERMKIFIGEDAFSDDERIIRETMRFIRGALRPVS